MKEALTFDDVMIVPSYSDIESRSEVDVSVELVKGFKFSNPFVPSNMKTISGLEMAKKVSEMGGLGFTHRFDDDPFKSQLDIIKSTSPDNIGASIGVKAEDYENVNKFVAEGVKIICVDVAHGYHKLCGDMCKYISEKYPDVLLVAGNVANGEAANFLMARGVDVIKENIGSGSICTTRMETGVGLPALTTLMEVKDAITFYKSHSKRKVFSMCDGGISKPGDAAKALLFADLLMCGNIFAGTHETPGEVIDEGGVKYKRYDGSSTHKSDRIEGVRATVPYKGSVDGIFKRYIEGVQSAASYRGARNLVDFKKLPNLARITNAGLKESHAHDVKVIG